MVGCTVNIPIVSLAPLTAIVPVVVRPANRAGAKRRSHCKRGHAMTPENIYTSPNGSRQCGTCRREYQALRSDHGHRSTKTRGNAQGPGKEPERPNHASGHTNGSQKGSPWREAGKFRSHGKTTL